MRAWFRLLRPYQWTKNAFIFFPLIFSGMFFRSAPMQESIVMFVVFCLISSSTYVVNDVLDREKDRVHPKKSRRPLASGEIKPSAALLVAALLVMGGVGLALSRGVGPGMLALVYLCLQLLYNLFFKHIVLWDVIFLALGFLVRIWAGAEAAGVAVSFWLFMCVFVLALFLGFGKRRGELASLGSAAEQHRSVLSNYTVYFLDQAILLCAALSIVFYGLYTISPELLVRVQGYRMVPSLVFVIYGILRYLFLIHTRHAAQDDPADLFLKDRPLFFCVLCWILFAGWVLYTG